MLLAHVFAAPPLHVKYPAPPGSQAYNPMLLFYMGSEIMYDCIDISDYRTSVSHL